MTPYELTQIRPRLLEFTGEMLTGLPRCDQRAKGQLYVRGLLTDGRRKSMEPMAARVGVDSQQFQQFITSSTWDYTPVRRNLAAWGASAIGPVAYVVDDTGMPKDGDLSACVAHQYCGQLGKVANCQVAVSIQMATDAASPAADWRLFCPKSWDDRVLDDPAEAEQARLRREKAKLPDDVRHREKWLLALDMLDEMTGGWGLPKLPVVVDSGYGDVTAFRLGLEDRGLDYVAAVSPDLAAHPADAAPAAPPGCRTPARPGPIATSRRSSRKVVGSVAFLPVRYPLHSRGRPIYPAPPHWDTRTYRSHTATIIARKVLYSPDMVTKSETVIVGGAAVPTGFTIYLHAPWRRGSGRTGSARLGFVPPAKVQADGRP